MTKYKTIFYLFWQMVMVSYIVLVTNMKYLTFSFLMLILMLKILKGRFHIAKIVGCRLV